ncbi:unnamed protein product [Thelazia callipaeda]|uniref:Zinc/iron permease n=1 Tax=Thelazia callipaeda TaxID=103827 RepID=A0A0N5CWS1_THECL|nr:unnamed protein product [Thelazia callipaeda]
MYFQSTTADFYGLLIAVMLHEVLCAFAFGVSIAQQRVSSKKAVIFSVIFAGSIPLGMSSSVFIGSSEALTASLFRFILEGFAAGAFIYVAFIEMLSSELNHSGQNSKAGFYKVLAVITGVFIFFIVNSVCHEHLHPFPQNTPLKTTVGKFPIDAY